MSDGAEIERLNREVIRLTQEKDKLSKPLAQQLQSLLDERSKIWEHEKGDLKRQIEDYKKGIERLKSEADQQKLLYQKSEQDKLWLAKQIKSKEEEIKKLQEERQKAEKVPPESEKLPAALEEAEEKRKELIIGLDAAQGETDQRLKLHLETKGTYQELLSSFNMEDEISKESSGVEKSFEGLINLKNQLEKMSPAGFLLETEKIQNEFRKLSQEAKAEVPWDSVLMAFLRRMREEVEKGARQSLSEEQAGKLQVFVEGRGFALIWPSVGDELVMKEHQILREDVAEGIGRGRVIRALTPGLKRGEEVILKAGVVLAR